ncbi:MAG: ArsR family transcriptional regulator, partial [Staphylococcus equorum]|nr:ArsR family transcriptional regulator [Staphylococcus equorum]
QEKANMSPSTVSHYLKMMQQVGLLESERHGQWTYYRRNEESINELANLIKEDL